MLGELLSRPKLQASDSYLNLYPEIVALSAIIEVKVETAIINENVNNTIYLIIILLGIILLIISSIAYAICMHSNFQICFRQPEINLSVTESTRCDEEKSNNLQNEENFRRYANPLKNSACSIRSASNVELNAIHDLSSTAITAGPSGLNRSQLCIFKSTNDFPRDFDAAATSSQTGTTTKALLYKTQNFDIDKNTIESQQSSKKDFEKHKLSKLDFKCFAPSNVSSITSVTTQTPPFSKNHQNNNNNNSCNSNSNDTLTLHI